MSRKTRGLILWGLTVATLLALISMHPQAVRASHTSDPTSVTIAGSFQSELGCPGDWQPECGTPRAAYDGSDDIWQGTFSIPAGSFEYKAALNGTWAENYGANATQNGPNIPLALTAPTPVKFYYDHKSHWITSNENAVIATAPGSFQSELGCPGDWQPDCLRSWLQDPDGDGIYGFSTSALPAGSYEVKVSVDESWAENYGEGGVQNGPNIAFTVPSGGAEIVFRYDPVTHVLIVGGAVSGNFALARAHWVALDTIAWNADGARAKDIYRLHYAPNGGMRLEPGGIVGGETISLGYERAGLSRSILDRFPHLAGYAALKLPSDKLGLVTDILKGQIAVSATGAKGRALDATSLQIPGVLDDLYRYDGPLGVTYSGPAPTLRVWAPTAKSVTLHLFADSSPATAATRVPMTLDPATGVWTAAGAPSWSRKFYLYEVEVYVRSTSGVERNLVTDPYSLSLSRNSQRSQIVDLSASSLKPAGWDRLRKPAFAAPEDIAAYELHVRDFSSNDVSVAPALRGTYRAFTTPKSSGMNHLAALAKAGLTHVQLLPAFDFTAVNELAAERAEPDPSVLASYPSDSDRQQAIVGALKDRDAYNWGYDPWHFTTPEGSYATNPDGPTRILEFRTMVKALNETGLRVVLDVVYNHTAASGQSERSVLDRIVPGYYHRLDADGKVETSTCCQNTASEHAMMEKLMVDSVVTWASEYKVDAFRFDLMGHHMRRNMIRVRDALNALTPARNGVEGSTISVYGEGWDFGEVANNARGVNATQLNLAGTGVGTFNDRVRDSVRGGSPFDSGESLKRQGFVNGLYYDPNGLDQGPPTQQKRALELLMERIRVAMAGNLSDYEFMDSTGRIVSGADVDYRGVPSGYTADPQEAINYMEAHDDHTLFDADAFKASLDSSMAERVRMQNLAMDVIGFGQGIPFFHAGVDTLRSKSLDRNSYNSGDWFNRLDFTYGSNNFGVGLPPEESNRDDWFVMTPLLRDVALVPTKTDILRSVDHLREVLSIRKSSPLFRLRTADEIKARLEYLQSGPHQVPGLIVLRLSDTGPVDLDPANERIVVAINATDEVQSFVEGSLAGTPLALHPVQTASTDPVVRTASFSSATGRFTVPARTTVVFVGS